jgi:hypothetical protein
VTADKDAQIADMAEYITRLEAFAIKHTPRESIICGCMGPEPGDWQCRCARGAIDASLLDAGQSIGVPYAAIQGAITKSLAARLVGVASGAKVFRNDLRSRLFNEGVDAAVDAMRRALGWGG